MGRKPFTLEESIGIRLSLEPEYQNISDEELYEVVSTALAGMTPEQIEGFWKNVTNIGSKALKIGAKALPGVIQGATTGAALGPLGALGGGLVGGLTGVLSKPKTSRPSPVPAGQGVPGSVTKPAGTASAQLLQLLQSPQLSQALTSLMMGSAARRTVPAAGKQVPVGAIMNLLGSLAGDASKEAAEVYAIHPEEAYLLDSYGNYKVDPAVPEQRAKALMELLQRDEEFLKSGFSSEEEWENDSLGWLFEAAEEDFPETLILEWE